jgi:hypothetical protein
MISPIVTEPYVGVTSTGGVVSGGVVPSGGTTACSSSLATSVSKAVGDKGLTAGRPYVSSR